MKTVDIAGIRVKLTNSEYVTAKEFVEIILEEYHMTGSRICQQCGSVAKYKKVTEDTVQMMKCERCGNIHYIT